MAVTRVPVDGIGRALRSAVSWLCLTYPAVTVKLKGSAVGGDRDAAHRAVSPTRRAVERSTLGPVTNSRKFTDMLTGGSRVTIATYRLLCGRSTLRTLVHL